MVGHFPPNTVPRGMVSMTALRFQSFSPFTQERTRFENVSNTFKCVSISFPLGIVFGHGCVNDRSKRNDFAPFRSYFVIPCKHKSLSIVVV